MIRPGSCVEALSPVDASTSVDAQTSRCSGSASGNNARTSASASAASPAITARSASTSWSPARSNSTISIRRRYVLRSLQTVSAHASRSPSSTSSDPAASDRRRHAHPERPCGHGRKLRPSSAQLHRTGHSGMAPGVRGEQRVVLLAALVGDGCQRLGLVGSVRRASLSTLVWWCPINVGRRWCLQQG